MKKRNVFIYVCMMAVLILGTIQVSAASAAPKVKSTEYKGKKKVEVEFKGKVEYKNVSVQVTDSSGKTYETTIIDQDDDDIEFKVSGAKSGKKYTYKISGIRKKGAGKYTAVKGSFKIAGKKKVLVEEVDYDRNDREVSFEFQGSVKWKKAKVTIKDSKGRNYVKRIKEKDRDEIEVKVKKLKSGKKYSYKISGVARKGSKSYKTITGHFTP